MDAVGNVEAAYDLAGKAVDTKEKIRVSQTAESDRATIQQAMKDPEFDLYTPQGVEKALGTLKGQLSPESYAGLVDHSNKLKAADLKMREGASRMSVEQLAAKNARLEFLMPQIKQLSDSYQSDVASKGEQYAQQQFEQNRNRVAVQLQQGGLMDEETAKILPSLNPQNLDAAYRGSAHGKQFYSTKLEEAKAEAMKTPGNWDMYTAKDGTYKYNSKTGTALKLGEDGQTWEPTQAIPPGAQKMGAAGSRAGAIMELPPEYSEKMAEYVRVNGKAPPSPQFGTGVAASQARREFYRSFFDNLDKLGTTPTDAAVAGLSRDASKEAIKRLTTQNAVIVSGEKDIEKVTKVLKDELQKLGGPDSPKLRALWNKGATEWSGNPEFSGINAAYANFLETSARVLSGQTGAGGTPVSYLELAKKSLGDNPNLEQISKLGDTMGKLFKAREESMIETIGSLKKDIAGPTRPAGGEGSVPKDVQSSRDSDAVKIIRDEYNDTVSKLKTAKGDERTRLLVDARAQRAELKRKGVDVPEPGAPVKDSDAEWKELAPGVRVRVKG
jgi:hypothetical protein